MERLRVQGVCPKCRRKLNRFAPPGRATVRVTCPRQGCDGTIMCRRVDDATAVEPEPKPEPPEPGAKPARKSTVERVRGYHRPEPKPGAGKPRVPAEVRGPGEPEPRRGEPERGEPERQPGDGHRPVRAPEPETGRRRSAYPHLFPW